MDYLLFKKSKMLDEIAAKLNIPVNLLKQQNIMNKTIAQQLNIKDFPVIIKDKNGNEIYYEDSNGYWRKYEYDQNGKQIYYENSTGSWIKYEYDQNGNEIYYEYSNGFWEKREYNQNGNQIYFENSNGYIIDNRPKVVELTIDQIAEKLNIDVNLLKIKK